MRLYKDGINRQGDGLISFMCCVQNFLKMFYICNNL